MFENKHTTLGQMKDFAQRQDARDDAQEDQLAQHEEKLGGVVKYTEQTLTDDQKAQARTNIGALSEDVIDSSISETVIWDNLEGKNIADYEATYDEDADAYWVKVFDQFIPLEAFSGGFRLHFADGSISDDSTEAFELAEGVIAIMGDAQGGMSSMNANGRIGVYFWAYTDTNGKIISPVVGKFIIGITTPGYALKKEQTIKNAYLPKAAAIPDVTAAPTMEEFNALLASLRAAGYLAE